MDANGQLRRAQDVEMGEPLTVSGVTKSIFFANLWFCQ